METTGKSVKELASSAGFVDEASFRRAFRRYAGMAPGAYRVLVRARNQPKGHVFALRKTAELIPEMLTQILDSCVNGSPSPIPIRKTRRLYMRTKSFSALPATRLTTSSVRIAVFCKAPIAIRKAARGCAKPLRSGNMWR